MTTIKLSLAKAVRSKVDSARTDCRMVFGAVIDKANSASHKQDQAASGTSSYVSKVGKSGEYRREQS